MEKVVGKLYVSKHKERRSGRLKTHKLIVLCTTGVSTSLKTFSGVVVKQTDETSDYKVGDSSTSWTSHLFSEYDKSIKLSNADWKPNLDIGCSPL